jgi:carboxypeptidase C (cathepsin A)
MFRFFIPFNFHFRFIGSRLVAATIVLFFSSSRQLSDDAAYRVPAGDAAFITAITSHHFNFNGKETEYQATTGYLNIKDDEQKSLANIFYTAYTLDSNNIANRPITFVFNGGPGSAAIWLHMGGFSPVKAYTGKTGYTNNPNTWLGFSDLVFIDPVGTGYSQPAQGVAARKFYGYREDINSIGKFIKGYLAAHHRQASPKFLAGESYGAVRAVGLAAYLQDSLQIKLAGLTLISPALNYRLVSFRKGNDSPYSYYLPTYAVTAQYHHRLSAGLQSLTPQQLTAKATTFSNGVYARFLASGKTASAQIIDSLHYFTGLSKTLLQQLNGRVTDVQFTKALLSADNTVAGTFDSRATGQTGAGDPSETAVRGLFTKAFQQYVNQELGYENHISYRATTAVGNWNYGPEASGGYMDISTTLKQVLVKNPDLKINVTCGYYDLATPVGTTDHVINGLAINKQLRANIRINYYNAGHMIYLSDNANSRFRDDSEQFYQHTLQTTKS